MSEPAPTFIPFGSGPRAAPEPRISWLSVFGWAALSLVTCGGLVWLAELALEAVCR